MPDIVVAPRARAPFAVELAVFEEDTHLVLSAGNFVRETRRDTAELLDDLAAFTPAEPGQLIVKGNRAYAIVHDLDREPSCDDQWIALALDALFAHCGEAGIRALALQPLGCVHAGGDVTRFVERLRRHPAAAGLSRIWVMA